MPQIDSTYKNIRTSAVLTTGYVAATVLGGTVRPFAREYNQLVLFVDVTMGSLTTVELKVDFAPYVAGASFYQETDETSSVAANVDTRAVNTVVHQFTVGGKYRLVVPLLDELVKVSVKGTGTVTSSSVAIDALLVKNYS